MIPGLVDGGAEAVLYRLCTADSALKHSVIALMDEGKYGPLLRQAGVPVHALGLPPGRVYPAALLRLRNLLRRLQPDVVQTWMYHGNLVGGVIGRWAGISRIYWGIHTTQLDHVTMKRSTVFVARVGALLSRWIPHRIIYCAESAAKIHTERGYLPQKAVVIPNGVDLAYFRRNSDAASRLRREWGVDSTIPLFGMVSRFDPAKDHENLIRALGDLRRSGMVFRCVLVGQGIDGDNPRLNQWIKEQGLTGEIILLGQRDDIPAVMSALDLHVLSSSSEALPNVLIEAMACETPCVTTDVGDAASVVGPTGWVAPARNHESLANAIREALVAWADPVSWRKRQLAARQRVQQLFSMQGMVEAYQAVWTESGPG